MSEEVLDKRLITAESPNMYVTCGKDKRDTEQRAEWTFHRGIPVLVEEVRLEQSSTS